MFVGVGIVTAYWFNFGMSFVEGPVSWRLPIAMQALFAIGVLFLVLALPESPRWLFNHGRDNEAVEVLCAVYDKQPDDEFIVIEKTAIIQAIELETLANKSKSFLSIFKNDQVKTGYRVLLAWGAQFMNQLGGINLVVYYIPSVLEQNVGMSVQMSQILGGCINIMFPLGSLLPTFALDSMGRRKTMMGGSLSLGVCMLFIAALLSQGGDESNRAQAFSSASVAFFFLYMLFFGMSMNCVPWVSNHTKHRRIRLLRINAALIVTVRDDTADLIIGIRSGNSPFGRTYPWHRHRRQLQLALELYCRHDHAYCHQPT